MINERLLCISDECVMVGRNGENLKWQKGQFYNITLDEDNNKIQIEYDNGMYSSCIMGFPSIVLLNTFNYNIIALKNELDEKLHNGVVKDRCYEEYFNTGEVAES